MKSPDHAEDVKAAPDSTPSTPWRQRVLRLLLAFYLLTAFCYGLWFPLGEGPDEPAHFFYADYLAQTGSLPVLQEPAQANATLAAHHPPLYYALSSLLLIFCSEQEPLLDFRPPPPGPRSPVFRHHALKEFPWEGRTLAWHLIRMFSAFLGLASLRIIWHINRILFPQSWVSVTAVGYLALNPQFAYLHSRVSNDAMAVFAGSLLLWLAASTASNSDKPFPFKLAGLVLSIALLSKLNAVFLAAGLIVGMARRLSSPGAGVGWREARGFLWLVGIPLLLAGWWFFRSWKLYGDPSGLSMVRQILPQNYYVEALGLAGFSAIFSQLIQATFRSSWPYFGWQGVELPRRLFNLIAFTHLLVWARQLGRWRSLLKPVPLALGISAAALLASYFYFNSMNNRSGWSGRFWFPASACAAAVFAAGWARLLGGREKLYVATLILAGLALNAYTYWWIIRPTYLNLC